jgi:hypothetical protein
MIFPNEKRRSHRHVPADEPFPPPMKRHRFLPLAHQIVAAATVLVTGSIPIALTLAPAFAEDDTFTLFSNDGVGPVEGTGLLVFNDNALSEGEEFIVGAQPFRISHAGGLDSNDIVLVAIPEPSAAFAWIAGTGVLAGLRKRSRKRPD